LKKPAGFFQVKLAFKKPGQTLSLILNIRQNEKGGVFLEKILIKKILVMIRLLDKKYSFRTITNYLVSIESSDHHIGLPIRVQLSLKFFTLNVIVT